MEKLLQEDPEGAWKKVLDEFRKIVGSPEAISLSPDIDKEPDINRSINIVKKVATFAISAGAPLPSQAQAVQQALEYFVETVQWYKQHYNADQVKKQLKEVSYNLERIAGYFENCHDAPIEKAFVQLITQNMAVFLHLCNIYNKIKKNSETASGKVKNTLKNILKSMLRWDKDIEGCIKTIRKLTEQEVSMNVAALRNSDNENNERRSKAEDAKELRQLLKIDETEVHWLDMQTRLEQQNVPQIGDWLCSNSKFKAWANIEPTLENAVLWLTGSRGYGKTRICSRAIQHLRERAESEEWSRSGQVSVAWFYLQNRGYIASSKKAEKPQSNAGTSTNDKGKDRREAIMFHTAVRTLIWQLTESDRNFQRFTLAELRKDPHAQWGSSDLWNVLVKGFCSTDSPKDPSRRKCFFLIIDGDDMFKNEKAQKVLQNMQKDASGLLSKERHQIRIMIAGEKRIKETDAGQEQVEESDADQEEVEETGAGQEEVKEKVLEIKLPRDSRNFDAEIFVKHHLRDLLEKWQKGTDRYRALYGLKKNLISLFSNDKVKCNYHILSGLMEEIKRIGVSEGSLHGLQEFNRKLGDSTITIEVIVLTQLERLNRDLNDEDKHVFNDIISCLVCSIEWPSIEQIHAFASLRRGRAFSTNIKDDIRGKYSNILEIQADDSTVESRSVLQFFEDHHLERPWVVQTYEDDAQTTDLPFELELVRAFTSRAPGHNVLMSSVLEMVKQRSLARPKLQFDYFTSQMTTIRFLLRAVCLEDHKERGELRSLQAYAGMYLPRHLWLFKDAADPSALKDRPIHDFRKETGKNLHHFFMDESCVRTWLLQCDPQELLENRWCDYLEDVQFWLRDPEVRKGFQEAQTTHKLNQEKTREKTSEKTTGKTEVVAQPTSKVQEGGVLQSAVEQTESIQLLSNTENMATTSPPQTESAEMIAKAEVEHQTLLLHVIRISAFQWLQNYQWDAAQALQWLIVVTGKAVESSENRVALGLNGYEKFIEAANNKIWDDDERLNTEDIIRAETWAGSLLGIQDGQSSRCSTKDVRVAQTLVALEAEPGHRTAENRCELAQNHDASSLEATLCLSKIIESNGNYKQALQVYLRILPQIQRTEFRSRFPLRWRDELDKFERLCQCTNSVRIALSACKELSEQPDLDAAEYVEKASALMSKADDLTGTFGVISAIREVDGRSLLTAVLHSRALDASFHQHLHLAFQRQHHLLLRSYTDAISGRTDHEMTPYLRYWYGISLFYQGRTTDAVQEWEGLCLDIIRRTEVTSSLAKLFSQTAERVASAYIGIAQGYEEGKTNLPEHFSNLEKWRKWIHEHHRYTVNRLVILLGRLYQVTGQPRKAQAMVQTHLSTAFKLLEDDRIDNDRKAYLSIAEAFLCLEDKRNAQAAWSLVSCAAIDEEENEEEVEEGKDTNEVGGNLISLQCNGGCGWIWDGRRNLDRKLYVCRDCPDVRFEQSCYKKLQDGTLKERVCSKKHSITTIPKMRRRDTEKIIAGHVLTDEVKHGNRKAELIDTWLAAARHRYGIPKPDQHWAGTPIEYSQMAKWRAKRYFDEKSGAAQKTRSEERKRREGSNLRRQ